MSAVALNEAPAPEALLTCPLIQPAPFIVWHWRYMHGPPCDAADIQRAALHEAGHAILAHMFNRLQDVSIVCDPDTCGEGIVGQARYKLLPTTGRQASLMAWAGPAAETLVGFPASDDWYSDEVTVAENLPRFMSVHRIRREAEGMLADNWHLVLAVANRLLERGQLSNRQVGWVLRKACAP